MKVDILLFDQIEKLKDNTSKCTMHVFLVCIWGFAYSFLTSLLDEGFGSKPGGGLMTSSKILFPFLLNISAELVPFFVSTSNKCMAGLLGSAKET